jgi:hypothetical protein
MPNATPNGLQAAAIQWQYHGCIILIFQIFTLQAKGHAICYLCRGQHLSFCDPFCMEIAIYKYVPFLTLPWPAFCFACGCGRDQISEAEASGQPVSQLLVWS